MEQQQRNAAEKFLYRPPQKLIRLLEWLQNATLSQQPAQIFYPENWLETILLDEMQMLLERYPTSIRRLDIVPLALEANETESTAAIRQLFLATMLWGYGTVGYGPWRMAHITSNIEQLDAILLNAVQNIKRGDVRAAYCGFQDAHIPFLGPAYFTKFLYFAGLGCGIDRFPLILDTRILQSLSALLGARTFSDGTVDDYHDYIVTLHEWAEMLDCRADSIEYLLSLTPQEFWQV